MSSQLSMIAWIPLFKKQMFKKSPGPLVRPVGARLALPVTRFIPDCFARLTRRRR
jgi:hypothetical protein